MVVDDQISLMLLLPSVLPVIDEVRCASAFDKLCNVPKDIQKASWFQPTYSVTLC